MNRALLVAAVFALAGCPKKASGPERPEPFVVDAQKPMPPGLDDAALDWSVHPCDDFYTWACGGWQKATTIPADKPLYLRSFSGIDDRNEAAVEAILREAAEGKLPKQTPWARQMGDVFASCMDEPKAEGSIKEVERFLERMAKPTSARDLASKVALLHGYGIPAFFSIEAEQDLKDATKVIVGLDQSGMGLPDRDYYLGEGAKQKEIRALYRDWMKAVFAELGDAPDKALARADEVLALETRLAKAAMSKVDRRDPQKRYNRLDRKGLREQASGFAWDEYFNTVGVNDFPHVNVSSVPFMQEVAAIAKDGQRELWRSYLRWTVLRSVTLALPKRFRELQFAFASKAFTGASEDRPRVKHCIDEVMSGLGEAIGREYVRRHFGDDGKARTSEMIRALQKAFEDNLDTLAWMDAPTKAQALAKVRAMVGNNKIGFPDKWRDYSAVETSRESFLANLLELERFETRRQLMKLGQPVDKTEWLMNAAEVNAYYEGQNNEIVFPAGILQPPFFDKAATDAVNFGAMGMVVGHEITHGFDDKGRQFDAQGNLKDWWTEASASQFTSRAACVREQYARYTAIDDVKVNGELTLGENVADLGGIKLSFKALRDWQASKGTPADSYRYTPEQQFFMGYAQAWCAKVRPENARMRAAVDTHAPPFLRVNGVVVNSSDFQQAFACKARSRMVAQTRCEVW